MSELTRKDIERGVESAMWQFFIGLVIMLSIHACQLRSKLDEIRDRLPVQPAPAGPGEGR